MFSPLSFFLLTFTALYSFAGNKVQSAGSASSSRQNSKHSDRAALYPPSDAMQLAILQVKSRILNHIASGSNRNDASPLKPGKNPSSIDFPNFIGNKKPGKHFKKKKDVYDTLISGKKEEKNPCRSKNSGPANLVFNLSESIFSDKIINATLILNNNPMPRGKNKTRIQFTICGIRGGGTGQSFQKQAMIPLYYESPISAAASLNIKKVFKSLIRKSKKINLKTGIAVISSTLFQRTTKSLSSFFLQLKLKNKNKERIKREMMSDSCVNQSTINDQGNEIKQTSCCRKPIPVNFEDFELNYRIMRPISFTAYYCTGTCQEFQPQNELYSSIMNFQGQMKVPGLRPYCAPIRSSPMKITLSNGDINSLSITSIPDLIVEECGCI